MHRELNKIDRDGREGGREREGGEKGAQQGRVFVLTPTAVRYYPQLWCTIQVPEKTGRFPAH